MGISGIKDEQKYLQQGLTKSEVRERVKAGLVNGDCNVKTKSIGSIIFTNVFTLFNGVNVFLAVCIAMVHSYKNLMFMGVVLWNILIGVVQEIRSKRVIDKLSLLSAPHANVIRDGEQTDIQVEDIVMDDIMYLKNGNQICADSIIVAGECQVNESLLTGEADPVYKKKGDEILSGSFIISGSVKARVIHVGKENYVNRIVGKAKYIKKPNSEIYKSIRAIIKMVTIALAPIAILLYLNQLDMGQSLSEAVVATVAAVIGMIPSGLVLLTSVVLAVSVIRMGRQNTLVQEMYCIETLAHVDVLCLDKTGTITEGTMIVEEVVAVDDDYTVEAIGELLKVYTSALDDNNPTFEAVLEYSSSFETVEGKYKIVDKEGFSSATKRSRVTFEEEGAFYLGALEFIAPDCDSRIKEQVSAYSAKGLRVLTLAHAALKNESGNKPCSKALDNDVEIVAFIIISDKIRAEARDTLMYFRNQGVALKVISGDNPVTVSNIAGKAGLYDADNCIDASTLLTEEEVKEAALKYSVFGRVSPNQKLIIVNALQEAGHTVAMTGDGVNDVMALKEADCSIAMESGSDAARNVSQLVLLDSNFAHMPSIMAEGRKTINNIQRSAALYISKTIYATILAIIFVFVPFSYPFQPIQLTLINALCIGLPSLVLALEPNVNRVKGSFLGNVLRMAIPGGLLAVTNVMLAEILGFALLATAEQRGTMAVYGLALAAAVQLYKVCLPFNKIRSFMFSVLVAVFCIAALFFKGFFGLWHIRYYHWIVIVAIAAGSFILHMVYSVLVETLLGTTPNIYKVSVALCEGKRVVMVFDDVEAKDYYDVTVQMKGLRVLRADSVIFVKKGLEERIKIESVDTINNEEIACAAKCYFKYKMKKACSGSTEVESRYYKQGAAMEDVVDNPIYTVSIGEDKSDMMFNDICPDREEANNYPEGYKTRVTKRMRITF